MIQRVQSLHLLIVTIAGFATYTLPLFIGNLPNGEKRVFPLAESLLLAIGSILLAVTALICIFLYKNRKLQFRLSVLGAILSFALLFLEYFVVERLKENEGMVSGSYQIGALLPIVMGVFFIMAARGIYKDEKLIKSMDRLR